VRTSPVPRISRRWWLVLGALALVLLALLALGPLLRALIATRVRAVAHARGLVATWTALDVKPPAGARFRGLVLVRRAEGDTLFRAESLAVSLRPWALLVLRPRIASVALAHAQIRVPGGRRADPDTLAPEETSRPRGPARARAERVRDLARSLVRALETPARNLPRLSLSDVTIAAPTGPGDPRPAPPAGAHVTWLELAPDRLGVRLNAAGRLLSEQPVPFATTVVYWRDDRISGGALFELPATRGARPESLRVTVNGSLQQDRRAGRVTFADSTRVTVGTLRFRLGGEAARQGPRFRLLLAADSLTAGQWKDSLPRAVLGPLLDLSIRGWYGYRVSLDLDLSHPDSVQFTADVLPHGLQIDVASSTLDLLSLDEPFVARIHLPRDRIVERDLSPANPLFRRLEAIDTLLVHAVVTNEDGAFFRHGGFNTDAVKSAIADNLKAGAFRRGAGTITMQLVRNLYLGHARTLSRKGQEVVLAWVLEHLTLLSKERMLEIYLNIIEWGPGVHGADEAARYYFAHDAGRLSVDEALFLATVVPAPTKWRYRFDRAGALRPFERAQMHFIGRAMVRKGWLRPESLPPADSLRVELLGPARDLLFVIPNAALGDSTGTHPDTAKTHADTTRADTSAT
jgi:transglycosylase-like protein